MTTKPRCALLGILLCISVASPAIAQESSTLKPGDRIRFRMAGNDGWRTGSFLTFDERDLLYTTNVAPSAEPSRISLEGIHALQVARRGGSLLRTVAFAITGTVAGAFLGTLVVNEVTGGDAEGEAFVGMGPILGAGAGVLIGTTLGLTTGHRWRQVAIVVRDTGLHAISVRSSRPMKLYR